MRQSSELSGELTELLQHTVADHLGPATLDQELVAVMCVDAVAFARTYSPHHVGQRARSAASLLLELACPTMSAPLRQELSIACELAAIGAEVRALH
ncbi:hypothetical protein [Marmoricola sp. RAF53]|uniref:hypothetical protein n=1 Tax=Marmoricola sp. RAF53 TaxID=3233059 RepID=UPI003F9E43DA